MDFDERVPDGDIRVRWDQEEDLLVISAMDEDEEITLLYIAENKQQTLDVIRVLQRAAERMPT